MPCEIVDPGRKSFSGQELIEEQDDDPDYSPPSACYRDLHNNTVTPMMAYEDFPYPKDTPWFIPQTRIHQYFKDYARNFGIDKDIKYNTKVEKVERTDDRQWIVTVCSKEKLDDGKRVRYSRWQDTFDALVVATGAFSDPFIPDYEYIQEYHQKYPNRILHSKQYRKFEDYRGKVTIN